MVGLFQSFATAAFGAFFGAFLALMATLWREGRERKRATTEAIINEFFSASFLQHRTAVSGLRRKVLAGKVSIESIASGFWYPGLDNSYSGDIIGEFNEHQHLTIYFGFLVRLAYAKKSRQIDTTVVAPTIRTLYFWHGDLISAVALEVRSQVKTSPGAELPAWVQAVDEVNSMLAYEFKSIGLLAKLEDPRR